MGKERIELVPGYLNQDLVVKIYFRFNPEIKEIIKSLHGRKWSQKLRYWYITKQKFNRAIFIEKLEACAKIDFSALTAFDRGEYTPTWDFDYLPEKEDPIKRFEGNHQKPQIQLPPEYLERLIRKRYSPNTIKTYTTYMKAFVEVFNDRELDTITKQEINDHILKLIRTRGISPSQQNQRINAIKYYYEQVLGKRKEYYILSRPKKEKKLPNILTVEEVELILRHCKNLKHKCILMTIYSGGLRRNELIHLKIDDVDSQRMLLRITHSKGNKDRYTLLSKKLLKLLREYYKFYKPKQWLFEGRGGGPYSATSIANIFKKALKEAQINKHATPHSLRHSFATHLLEQGINLRYIQEILGHSSTKTTEIYTHVCSKQLTKIQNPLDNLNPD